MWLLSPLTCARASASAAGCPSAARSAFGARGQRARPAARAGSSIASSRAALGRRASMGASKICFTVYCAMKVVSEHVSSVVPATFCMLWQMAAQSCSRSPDSPM
eukprot:1444703-Prymnesium_polylepis.1